MSSGLSGRRWLVSSTLALLAVAALTLAVGPAPVAADGPDSLDCIDDAGGAAYSTETGLTVYEDGDAITFGQVTANDTLSFGDRITLSAADAAHARLENGTGSNVCLAAVNASAASLTVSPNATQSVTIEGDLDGLAFGDVDYGTDSSDFVYNASESVTLTFASTGLDEGTTIVAQSPADESEPATGAVATDGSVTVVLPSTEKATAISLREQQAAGLNVSGQTLAFGETAVGGTVTQSVNVTNEGSEPVRLNQSDISGPDADAFALVTDTESAVLQSGASRSIAVRYRPTGSTSQRATLTLAGDDARATVALSGSPVVSRAEVNTTALQFGEQVVGESVTRRLAITNPETSTTNLTIQTPNIVGQNRSEFATRRDGTTLAPGEQTTIPVTLTPTTPGDKQASLQIVTDSPASPQINVWLSNTQTILVVERVTPRNATAEPASENGDTVPTVQVRGRNIPPEMAVSVNVSQPETRASAAAVDGVDTTFEEGGDFSMNVTHDADPANDVPAFAPEEEAIRYVSVNHTFSNADVTGSSFRTRVSKQRLAERGVDPDAVSVGRYHDGEWTSLPATRVGETATHYRYRVDTPGFSEFAISAPVPSLSVESVRLDQDEIQVGETVTVRATVANDGSADATFTAGLRVDGTQVTTNTTRVVAGTTETVRFDRSFSEAGEYAIAVNDTDADTLVVAPSDASSSVDASQSGDRIGVPVIVLGVLFVLFIVVVLWRRRDDEDDETETDGEG